MCLRILGGSGEVKALFMLIMLDYFTIPFFSCIMQELVCGCMLLQTFNPPLLELIGVKVPPSHS